MARKERESNSLKRGGEKEGVDLSPGLWFVALIFLIKGGYQLYEYSELISGSPGEMMYQALILIYPLLAFYYLATMVGVLKRKSFALVSGSILLVYSAIGGSFYRYEYPPELGIKLGIINVFASLFALYFLLISRKHFKGFGMNDLFILAVMVLLIPTWVFGMQYAQTLPRPAEYAEMVTKEAIERGDWRVCEKLQSGWRGECIRGFAENKKNPKLCELLTSQYDKDLCYLHIADELNDPELCKLIKNNYDRGMCYDFTKQS